MTIMTTTNNNRFIVYADFLGTKHRYSTPALVVRGRELLEQALESCVVPHLSADDMYLYVYSDTAIVTCPRLEPLLGPIADLFGYFVELHDMSDDMTLWLRAAISHGTCLKVDHLQTSDRIRTIPLLDTSLPTAYQLESIRRGSRVFVDPDIPDAAFEECAKLFFKWQQITGRGQYVANVREYFWPAKRYYDNGDRLARITLRLNQWWSDELKKRVWPKDDYYDSRMIHLDETLKLFVRTCPVFCSEEQRKKVLFSLLPKTEDHGVNIQYEWGVWFQALRGIVEGGEMSRSTTGEFESAFNRVKAILTKNRYFEHFLGELEFPDYASFRRGLCAMGLHESD